MYDFQVVNLCRALLEDDYPATDAQRAALTSAALLGSVAGQLCFGVAADALGRRTIFILTATITATASVGAALARDSSSLSIYTALSLWRFLLGFGIGGEYPLSAAHTAEAYPSGQHSGRALALVYANMGMGSVAAPIAVLVLLSSGLSRERVWRTAFGLGGALSAVGVILRWRIMHETEAFEAVRKRRSGGGRRQDGADESTGLFESSPEYLAIPLGPSSPPADASDVSRSSRWATLLFHWRPLLGTAGSWLLYDAVDYGLGLYTADFDTLLGLRDDDRGRALGVLYIALLTLPGYWIGVALVESRLGRRGCQLLGFCGMAVMFFLLVGLWEPLQRMPVLLLVLYGVQVCFDALGPGMTTYVIPAEVFPTSIRATAHGISAATGKAGAVLGTSIFPRLQDGVGLQGVLAICGGVCVAAVGWTLAFTPSYGAATLARQRAEEDAGLTPDPRALYGRTLREGAAQDAYPDEESSAEAMGPVLVCESGATRPRWSVAEEDDAVSTARRLVFTQ